MDKTEAVMALSAWFSEHGIKKGWFAEQLGVDNASISRWLSGKVRPHKAVRKRIEQLTDGRVCMDRWE